MQKTVPPAVAVVLVVIVLVIVALFATPGPPRVDGSSEDAMMESLEDVIDAVAPADRPRLEEALMTLTSVRLGDLGSEHEALPSYRRLLNGLTAEEIIELSKRYSDRAPERR